MFRLSKRGSLTAENMKRFMILYFNEYYWHIIHIDYQYYLQYLPLDGMYQHSLKLKLNH